MARTPSIAHVLLTAAAALAAACGGETQASPPPSAASVSTVPSASYADIPPTSASFDAGTDAAYASADAGEAGAAGPAAKYTGFATPESVLYDADGDRYLVSNINGKPTDADNNGFISVLAPEGSVTTLKWIEGGKQKVKLNAPKGLAIADGVLYVADLTAVRMFDMKTAAPKGEVTIPGAMFLNDMAAGPDGKVYVSDTGLKASASGLEPAKGDAVWVIEKGKAKPIAKSPDLGGPNGLVVEDKSLIVVTFGSGEAYRLDAKGKKDDVTKLPQGMLDGVVALPDSLLISSWAASSIYRGKLGGTFEVALSGQKTPADIGYDTKRSRVLVPHFTEDTVEAYDLK